MAITPEFLAQQIEKAENIQAVFDQQILPQEGEPAEGFQQRKQTLIDQTMALVGKGPQMPTVNPKVLDIPIIMDCLGTPLTEGYVDSEGKTYDVSNLAKIPVKLRWQNNGKPVVNRALNDNLDVINKQFLKTMIATQWIMENIPPAQQNDYKQKTVTVNDDDYPSGSLRCPILFENFGPEQKAFIYEDGYSVSSAEQPKSPFTNLPLTKKIGTPNHFLNTLANDYLNAVIEYKKMITQYPTLEKLVDATIEEKVQEQKEKRRLRIKETEEEKDAIEKYTRRLGIRAQLQLERNNGVDVQHKDFQKINCDGLFTMDRIRTEYPDIEQQISVQAIQQARQNFVHHLNAVPIEILRQYDNARNEYFGLIDKINSGSLLAQETDIAMDRQRALLTSQRQLEKDYPEIRYRLLLDQARGIPIQATADLKRVSLREHAAAKKPIHSPFFPYGNGYNTAIKKTSAREDSPHANSSVIEGVINFASQTFSRFFPGSTPGSQPSVNPDGYDYSLKFSLIGDSGVGKSSLLRRFVDDIFTDAFISTLDAVFKIKTIDLNGSRVKLQIGDTIGQEQFRPRAVHAIIVAFDVTDRQSFENITKWLQGINTFASPTVILTLAATKCDVPEAEWAVSKDEIKALAEGLMKSVFFTSAKDNAYIDELFECVADSVLQKNVSRPSNSM